MGRQIELTNNRKNVYYFITRAKRFHANVSATYEIDVTPLLNAITAARAAGRTVSLNSALVKATALVIEKYPQLNRHFFHGILRRFEYEPDGIHCGLLVNRTTEQGEDIIIPAVIPDANQLTVDRIDEIVREYKKKPLLELPEFVATHKLRNAPTLVRALIAFGAKAIPSIQEKVFAGTYALSAVAGSTRVRMVGAQGLSPTAASFMPGTVVERPWVVDGVIAIRKVLPMTFVVDHYVVDGVAVMAAMEALYEIIADPGALGLPVGKPSTSTRAG